MSKKKVARSCKAADDLQKKTAEKETKRIRSLLSVDPDWKLATGLIKLADLKTEDDWKRANRAVPRIIKKAIQLLYPQYKCSVRRCGRGTANGWVCVNIIVPELDWRKSGGTWQHDKEKEISQKTEDTLIALGISFGRYTPDLGPGLNDPQPCLSIEINEIQRG